MCGVSHGLFLDSANVFLTASAVGIELPILSVGSVSANHFTNWASLSLLSQAPYLADSMLQMYHRSLCLLPSIVNPRVALQVLESTVGVDMGP